MGWRPPLNPPRKRGGDSSSRVENKIYPHGGERRKSSPCEEAQKILCL